MECLSGDSKILIYIYNALRYSLNKIFTKVSNVSYLDYTNVN